MDPLRLVAAAWWAALVAIALLQQAHADLHEHRELPVLLHVLRDGALAVPAAGIAVLLGALLVAGRSGATTGRERALQGLIWAVVSAAIFAVLSIPGGQLHGVLFGAEEEEISWLADVALDGSIAFVGSLVALVALALVTGPPVRRPAIDAIHQIHDSGLGGPHPADQLTGSTL